MLLYLTRFAPDIEDCNGQEHVNVELNFGASETDCYGYIVLTVSSSSLPSSEIFEGLAI